MVLDLVDVYQYYSPQKNPLQISTHNLCFEIYLHFLIFCDKYYFDTNIFRMFKFVNVWLNLFLTRLV
jgi:hypothetical protein